MKRLLFLMVCSLVLFSMASCKKADETEVNQAVYLEGEITELYDTTMIVVDENQDPYSINITKDDGKEYIVGMTVLIEHSGEVMESYPMQLNVISIKIKE